MNWKFWAKKKPVVVVPPPPKPFHAGGTLNRDYVSWQGKKLFTPKDAEERNGAFMDLVPLDIKTQNIPETYEEIKVLSAAMKQPDYQQPRMYVNPMQDIDYMIITGLMKTTFGGPLMESYTKFMVGTGFRCELVLRKPSGDKKKDKETLEKFKYVKEALDEIDRKMDDNDEGALDIPFVDLVTQAVSAAWIYNRAVLKFQYGKPVEVMGKTYKGIPTAMQYIHPRELGAIEVNQAGQLLRVAESTMNNLIETKDMIYVWNPIVTAVEPNATWYGGSKVLPMVDALRQLRYTLSRAFPSMSKNAWAGLFLLFVKPQGQTEAVKQQEYEQVMSSMPRGDGAALMEDPEDVAVENITFDAKFEELKNVAEFCIKTCIAKLGLPNSMFFDEASFESKLPCLGKIQLAIFHSN